jgi:hypothetical protein
MLSIRRLVVTFVAVSALLMGAVPSAQAAATFAPQTTSTQAGASAQLARTSASQTTQASSPWCSSWYTTVPGLRFYVCVSARTVTGGAWVRSIVTVVNSSGTSRYNSTRAEMVVNGRVQPPTVCGKLLLSPGGVRKCPSQESFVVKTTGSYAYARGYVYDYSSGVGHFGYSPVYRP